jgi:outer membrane lipoprotein SlyB
MAARLRLLAALLAATAEAQITKSKQPLDLKFRTESKGTVVAIRDAYASGKGPATGSGQSSGTSSGPDQGLPVGAVAYWNFGPGSTEGMRVGAVGQGDMQPWLTDHAKEIVVKMDDGERRIFRPRDAERFQLNERVSVSSGVLEPLK